MVYRSSSIELERMLRDAGETSHHTLAGIVHDARCVIGV